MTEHLHAAEGPRSRTIFATHYHELTQLAEQLPRLVNVHVTVREVGEQVLFLHQIAEGAADRSYGIHVARLAGLPASLIARAREVLAELESERTAEHLTQRSRRPGGPARQAQPELPLFPPEPHPVLAGLRELEIEKLTPLEAMNRLAEWKRRWGADA